MSNDKDAQTANVQTLDELEAKSDELRCSYDKLPSAAPVDPERTQVVHEIKSFLHICADHGRYVPIGTPERRCLRNLVDYWTSRLSRDRIDIKGIRELDPFDAHAGVPLVADCPYPGLEPYDDKFKGDFFGREKLAVDYVRNLEAKGVFLIIGGSGSGKSSVALAGVQPLCQRRQPDWCFPKRIKPGSDPLRALAASITEETAGDAEDLAHRLTEKPANAASILGDALKHKPTLLIFDQFEEVLTLCRDAAAQKAFTDALLALAPVDVLAEGRGFYLLFTMRSDHLGSFEDNRDLKPLYDRLIKPDCNANLPAMQQNDILQAILRPAQRVRLRFVPPDVAERLAGQTASVTNGLPLLQFALRHLWDGRAKKDGNENGLPLDFISEKQLNKLPDVASALGTHAESVYAGFNEPQKRICERLMLELVFLDEKLPEPMRRRRSKADLVAVIRQAMQADPDAVEVVINTLVRERMLSELSENQEGQLEVAHEALLRYWKTIRNSVDSEKARLFRIKEVQKEAADWKRSGRSEDWLKQRGVPLTKVEKDVEDFFLNDPDSQEYVAACRKYDDELNRAADAQQKAQIRLWLAVAVAVIVGVIGVGNWLVTSNRNASNLNAFASLSDRLPPSEGLNLAMTLAKNNPIYSKALGHALERMDYARIVGTGKSRLTLLGDGAALLEIPTVDRSLPDTVYLYRLLHSDGVDEDLLSSPDGLPLELGGKFQSGYLGARIEKAGAHQGKQMFVAIVAPQVPGGDSTAKAWLIDFDTAAIAPITVPNEGAGKYISQIAMSPDGLEASWGIADAERLKGRLVSLGVEKHPTQSNFRIKAINRPEQIIFALGYVSDGKGGHSLVRATNAGLFCGEEEENKTAELPAVNMIATALDSDVFAVGRGDGQIGLARCDQGKVLILDERGNLDGRGNPSSVRLQRIEKNKLLFSYQMTGGGFLCYEVSGDHLASKSCNPNHLVATAALQGKNSQVELEWGGAPVIRRYPSEFAWEEFRFLRAGLQGDTVLCSDGTVAEAGKSGKRPCAASMQNAGTDVALSPSGTYKAVMTRTARRAEIAVAGVSVGGTGSRSSQNTVEDFLGNGGAFAIDDKGRLAYFQRSKENNSELMIVDEVPSGHAKPVKVSIDGVPTCLSLSPKGRALLVGTDSGHWYRYSINEGTPIHTTDVKGSDVGDVVTACAIADDSAATLGLRDGSVFFFGGGDVKGTTLTERASYRLPVQVKAVRIDDVKSGRRVTALGAWQPNNCLYPALPGQSLRVWELDGKERETIPVSTACLPNQPVLALGGWTTKTKPLPKTPLQHALISGRAAAGASQSGEGISLLQPQGVRWFACPACSGKDESDSPEMQQRLLDWATAKGGIPLNNDTLSKRYGFKLGLW